MHIGIKVFELMNNLQILKSHSHDALYIKMFNDFNGRFNLTSHSAHVDHLNNSMCIQISIPCNSKI